MKNYDEIWETLLEQIHRTHERDGYHIPMFFLCKEGSIKQTVAALFQNDVQTRQGKADLKILLERSQGHSYCRI